MWNRLLFASLLNVVAWNGLVSAAIVTESNTSNGTADNFEFTRQVTFNAADFGTDGTIIGDVNVSINFAKSNDASFVPDGTAPSAGTPFLNQIEFTLMSPTGTLFTLISNAGLNERVAADSTASFGTGAGNGPFQGRINFDQQAATAVNADPNMLTPGTFQPANNTINSLNIFNGEDATANGGTWTLFIENDASGRVLSFYDFNVTIQSVPEPTSMVMLGVCGSIAALGAYRRKRANAKSELSHIAAA